MKVAPYFDPRDAQACVVSIGVFDGVHRGHRRVLETLREAGARRALPTVVVTFDPHPRLVLQPHKALPMLVSLRRRLSLLAETGNVDRCIVLPFDQCQREQSADDFVHKTLVERLGMRALVVGENFVCGRGRVGTVDYLRRLGGQFGFAVDPVAMDVSHRHEPGVPSSSTETRRLIQAGHVMHAAALLGRPHELECVVAGNMTPDWGYELMLPTGMCVPAAGNYAALASVHRGRPTWVSVQLTLKDSVRAMRCFLRPVGGTLAPTPGTPVIVEFLDTLRTDMARDLESDIAA